MNISIPKHNLELANLSSYEALDKNIKSLGFKIQSELNDLKSLEQKRTKYWEKYKSALKRYEIQTKEYEIINLHDINQHFVDEIIEEKFSELTHLISIKFNRINKLYQKLLDRYELLSQNLSLPDIIA